MNIFRTLRPGIFLLGGCMVLGAGVAHAADLWLQCEGTLVTAADGRNDSKPAHDVYAYNDESRHFFKYSESRKTLDPLFTTDYSSKQIKWASPGGASYGEAVWDATLDRSSMALKLVRKEKAEVMTWSESCKPTQPLIN